MPLYEFECPVCEHVFETIRTSSQSKKAPCPECGALAKRILSAFGIGTQNQHQNIDRAVGADAEKRWDFIHKKQERKEKLIKEGKLKRPEKVFVSKKRDDSFI